MKKLTEKQIEKKIGDLLNWGKEKVIFAEISFAVFEDIVERRGKRAADLIGSTFEMTESVRKFIDKKSITFADEVNETTRKHLRETLKEGVGAGEGIGDLTKRVEELFDNREKWEAERIARTEVIEASNGAELEAYKQSEVVEKKEWLIAPGACDICEPLNGEVVELDKDFGGEFDYPPAHPNCRCTILPVIEEERSAKKVEVKEKEEPIDVEKLIERKIIEAEKNIDEKVDKKLKDGMDEIEKTIDEALE